MDYRDQNMKYTPLELSSWALKELRSTRELVDNVQDVDPVKRLLRLGCTLGVCAEKETHKDRRKELFAAIRKITELEMGIDALIAVAIGSPLQSHTIAGHVATYIESLIEEEGANDVSH